MDYICSTQFLGVALVAFIYEKNATSSKTFGYKRFEVLALFNGVTLFVISIVIIVEAIKRFLHHPKFNQQKCLLLV